jgi:hypothetical protein
MATGLTAWILGVREGNTPTPYWTHEAIRLCILGQVLSLTSIILFSFCRGWRRIGGVIVASLLLVYFGALLALGD